MPPPLPNVSLWQPRNDASESLESAFLHRCIHAEQIIKLKAQYEIESRLDGFDSGPGIEDAVREQISAILPNRYSVRSGVINDSRGQSGGDYDVVVFNSAWFPEIKAGAAPNSRRAHLPIEGVYAVGEVKQTLNYHSLDDAMKKLVICHRLYRPPTSRTRISENRDGEPCRHGLTNPLYSFILATRIATDIDIDSVIERFVRINQRLRRLEMVRALCILDAGTVQWVVAREGSTPQPALFMDEDLHEPLHPGYERVPNIPSALYSLMQSLLLHLFHSVLGPEDIPTHYGMRNQPISIPTSDEWSHNPYIRPVDGPGFPYSYEFEPFAPAEIGPVLGAHPPRKATDGKEPSESD